MTGTVSPATATVEVGGLPVHVVNGAYTVPMQLGHSIQTITITGRAVGYLPSNASTTVHYSSQIASSIEAVAHPKSVAVPAPKLNYSTHPAGPATGPNVAPPIPPAVPVSLKRSSSAKSTSSGSTASNAKASRSKASSSHKSSSRKSSRSRSSSAKRSSHTSSRTTKTSSRSSNRIPESRTVLTVKDIKHAWVNGCVRPETGQTYTAYCRCTYHRLARAGALSSRRRLRELMRRLKPYKRTHNVARLPRFVRRAIYACVTKLPPIDPLAGKPVINKLPTLSHPARPLTSSPTTTDPAPTSTVPSNTPAPTGAPVPTTTPTNTQTSTGTPPTWASLFRELDRLVTVLAKHKPSAPAPADHRSVRKSHSGPAERRLSPQRRHKRAR